jgi:hypothetical protein
MKRVIWALFGNDEDGIYGTPGWSTLTGWRLAVAWWLRNPCHNLCFHVVGVCDFHPGWSGRFDGVFPSDDASSEGAHWNWGFCTVGQDKYPFLAYEGLWGRGYIGWRKGGAFAIRPPVKAAIAVAVAIIGGWFLA